MPSRQSARSAAVTVALALLLAWSFALRAWFATPDLGPHRFGNERFGAENIHSLLVGGRIRPANGFYPGLSYVPHAAVLAASQGLYRLTGRAAFAVVDRESLTPNGYLLCRLLQALAGTLSIYLIYRIGRRLASPAVGLVGALLLAVVPWHLRQSVVFKPDILLIAMIVLAFAAALAAAERPTRSRFLWAGAAVGLALAAKFNAVATAIPIVVAALAEGGWCDRRRWGVLVLAGAAAIAAFLLFTPFVVLDLDLYRRDFVGVTMQDYSGRAHRLGSSHLLVLVEGMRTLLSDTFHGPVIGTLGLLGLPAAAAAAWRRRTGESSRARRLGPAMALSYVAGYALSYSLATANPSDHNWLPVAPFVALAGAWALVGIWSWLAARLPLLARPAVAAAAFAIGAILVALPADSYVYDRVVPTTWDLAQGNLREQLQPLSWRLVIGEGDEDQPWDLKEGPDQAAERAVDRLEAVPAAALAGADAELFHADRLRGGSAAFYRGRLAAPGAAVARFEPKPFRAQGTALVEVIHPWPPAGEPEALAVSPPGGSRSLAAALPPTVRPGDVASLEVSVPRDLGPGRLQGASLQGRPLDPVLIRRLGGFWRFLTGRFVVPAAGAPVTLTFDPPLPPTAGIEVRLQRWQGAGPGQPGTLAALPDPLSRPTPSAPAHPGLQ